MLPKTTLHVKKNTSAAADARIRRKTEMNIAYHAAHPGEIDARLKELEAEWDIERTLEVHASSMALAGTALGATVDRKWFVLPAVVAGFLLQHALQGWCPPVSLFRRLGVRTQSEIDFERYALKAIRGDFRNLPDLQKSNGHGAIDKVIDALES
jgi:Protein of unknown function (DUF2892)